MLQYSWYKKEKGNSFESYLTRHSFVTNTDVSNNINITAQFLINLSILKMSLH